MSDKQIAVFPGSFDPITVGHEDIIKRALPLVDQLVIAIGINSEKKHMIPLKERLHQLEIIFKEEPQITVDTYQGLTVSYCKKIKARYLIRGLRNTTDFEYERNIANMNKEVAPGTDTLFFMSSPEHVAVSSTIVREIMKHGGSVKKFLPKKFPH